MTKYLMGYDCMTYLGTRCSGNTVITVEKEYPTEQELMELKEEIGKQIDAISHRVNIVFMQRLAD